MAAFPQDPAHESVWSSSAVAAALFAVDPVGLGGVSLRSLPGPLRQRWLAYLRELLPASVPVRRMPVHISDSRLLGGLDLVATLRAGKPVAERGLLAEADGGVLLAAMAERLPPSAAAHLAAALDTQRVALERDGIAARIETRFGVVALDEGIEEQERPSAALLDRLAFHVDLTGLSHREISQGIFAAPDIAAARARLSKVTASDSVVESLCATAIALGIASVRAPILALRAARAAAALAGRQEISTEDAAQAGRLVFGSRATVVPTSQEGQDDREEEGEPQAPQDSDGAPQPESPDNATDESNSEAGESINDVVLAAASAAIPAGLLAQMQSLPGANSRAGSGGRAGALRQSLRRGRPAGVRRGLPRAGVRLNVVETLRAAAPWQRLRRAGDDRPASVRKAGVDIRPEDFHVTRYRQRSETTTIFALDASGSSALHRLAEAKGAIELLLADCYVRRDQVAVLSFRGRGADLILPPTRSLVRAKRSLAGLAGGGGTPLAAGIDAAMILTESVLRLGATPTLVVLTDGRANIGRDGAPGRERAEQDALASAQRVRASGIRVVLIDTSPRPQPAGQKLAAALGARYVPLPYADANALARAVQEPAPGRKAGKGG